MATSTFAFEHAPRALVVGGAGGIGRAIASRLVDAGGSVVVADLPAAFEAVSPHEPVSPREAASPPGHAGMARIPMDVRDEASVRDAVAQAAASMNGLDTVVNAAGICRLARLEDVDSASWEATLGINLTGTFLVMREAMPYLLASGAGRIVNIASDAGKRGYPLLGAYCASKFGVVGLTQAIAAEVAPMGVRVNAVCPSTVADTAMGRDVAVQRVALGQAADTDELALRRIERFPLGRSGNTDDVAEAAMFLLSDSSNWITGEALNVDGGSLAG